jgi:hypothetical protein
LRLLAQVFFQHFDGSFDLSHVFADDQGIDLGVIEGVHRQGEKCSENRCEN